MRSLEIREADVAVREEAEAPFLDDGYLCDLTPLAADRDVGAEEEQLCAGRDAFTERKDLGPDDQDLRIEPSLF